MKLSTMPYAVQLRELQRQELYAEADHERLVRDAATMMPRQAGDLFGLRGRVAGIRTWIKGPRCQRCSAAIDQLSHRPLCKVSAFWSSSRRLFRDRIRGEGAWPWGVAEAQALGLHELVREQNDDR